MAKDKKTYEAPSQAPPIKTEIAHSHSTDDWLHDWHNIVFPLRNGATLQAYKPKIEKYINSWLDLVNDVDQHGRKFKLRDFEFHPVGISGREFKVIAKALPVEETGSVISEPNINKTKSTGGGGLPGEKPGGQHLTPTPPPPPPK